MFVCSFLPSFTSTIVLTFGSMSCFGCCSSLSHIIFYNEVHIFFSTPSTPSYSLNRIERLLICAVTRLCEMLSTHEVDVAEMMPVQVRHHCLAISKEN